MADAYKCAFCGVKVEQAGGVPSRDEHGKCVKTGDGTHSWRRVS